MLLLASFAALPVTSSDPEIFSKNHVKNDTEENWYYLPSYPNYAPNGLPDFDEHQQDSWFTEDGIEEGWPLFCGAAALANVFWWFDSKHADQNGSPGDGNDTYPLVQDYNAPEPPNPGPYSDDHNFNNVNDNRTPFRRFRRNGEFIEQIAWYASRFLFFPLWWKLHPFKLMDTINVYLGAWRWLIDANLQKNYTVQLIFKPNFSTINTFVRNNCGVILVITHYNPKIPLWKNWGHYTAVAGINSNGQIALSDSIRDEMNPSLDPAEHNNASIVSHDIWAVNFTSPYPLLSSWWLPDYTNYGVIVVATIIISEREQKIRHI